MGEVSEPAREIGARAERGITLNALAVEAFNDVLRKYGRRASVENPLLD
jgi:hypothetical protein